MSEPFKGVINVDIRDSTPDWAPFEPPKAPDKAPNVVYIVLDDVGFSAMSCYGGPIPTPNIDKIAADGVRYTQWHTTALCSPTRSCLLTGRNHTRNSMACITEAAIGFPNASGTIPPEDLGEHAVLGRDRAAAVGEPDAGLGDAGHAVARVVAAGEQARTGRRAERRCVPLREAHAVSGDLVDVGRRDRAAVARHRRESDVVQHNVHDVGRPVRRLRRLEGRPVGRRVPDVDVDDSLEWFRHASSLPQSRQSTPPYVMF